MALVIIHTVPYNPTFDTLYDDGDICASSTFMKLHTQVKLALIWHLFFPQPALCVCFALKIDLQLVLFHSICRSLSLSSERWRTVHLLCLLCWVGGGWMQFTRFPRSHRPLSFFLFFSFSLRAVSQPCPHYPFLSSIMVQGLLNFLSPGTKFRKCSLTPGPGLMTTSTCCTN